MIRFWLEIRRRLRRKRDAKRLLDLWARGRMCEMFDLPYEATIPQLLVAHHRAVEFHRENQLVRNALDNARATLNTEAERRLYSKARSAMKQIEQRIGHKSYAVREAQIWVVLWPDYRQNRDVAPADMANRHG